MASIKFLHHLRLASMLRTSVSGLQHPSIISVLPSISETVSINKRLFNTETVKDTTAEEIHLDDSKPKVHPSLDRSKVVPLETSIRYMNSAAYQETYGENPVWFLYRRNFKGQFAPKRTRSTCIINKVLQTGNPCPICRDEYLVLDYRNVKLIKQFISPYNGQTLHWDKTGLCRKRQYQLLVEIEKAKDYGTITFDIPIRQYDYADYFEELKRQQG